MRAAAIGCGSFKSKDCYRFISKLVLAVEIVIYYKVNF